MATSLEVKVTMLGASYVSLVAFPLNSVIDAIANAIPVRLIELLGSTVEFFLSRLLHPPCLHSSSFFVLVMV
jgi:hypothetical protein